MKKSFYYALIIFVLILAGLACSTSDEPPSPTPDDSVVATSVAATLTAQGGHVTEVPPTEPVEEPTDVPEPTAEPTPEPTEVPGVLPHSLYYLAETAGVFQVWKMNVDGITTTQVTNEPSDVFWFDVSPVDGSVAYTSNNLLLLVQADGSGRTVLVDGGPVGDTSEYYWRLKIDAPRFSPDGAMLAFAQNGLNIYYFATGNYENLLTNELEISGGVIQYVRELFFPAEWSPDGTKLLMDISWFEGGTMGIWDFGTNSKVDFVWSGIVCCDAAWAPDSNSVVVASPYLGLIISGMWRFDANTGVGTALLDTPASDGTFNYAGWPIQLPDNTMRFFYHNSPTMIEGDVIMHLVSAGLDGNTGLAALLPDNFDIFGGLWAPDGSRVVIVLCPAGPPVWPQRGPLVLINTNGDPAIPLGVTGYNLVWGP